MNFSRIARNFALTVICVILGTMLAWQYKSVNNLKQVNIYENMRREELKDELIKLQKTNDDLLRRLQQAQNDLNEYKSANLSDEQEAERIDRQLKEAMIFGCMTDVTGPGLIITLKNGDFFTIQDDDLLALINELRASDAQAISLNDERIAAMTEIRSVSSSYIMVNGTRITAPYVIKAIGDPEKMEHSIKMIGGIVEELESYDFKVTVEKSGDIIIPAVRDDGTVIKTDLMKPLADG